MVDRAIGIAGLALALIFGVLYSVFPQVSDVVAFSVIALGVLMLGVSIGLLAGGRRRSQSPVSRALLRLHVYADSRVPDRIAAENIFRWFYLHHEFVARMSDGTDQVHALPTLFVTFEPEVEIATLKVRSPDMSLPRFEVKDFNQRFAIISFVGVLPEGTLEVTVEP